jgi:sigma-B regulation protein RsbU (phosphoserine phosphatase)
MTVQDGDPQTRFRHEARTVLNHVIGFSELLAGDINTSTNDVVRTALKNIGESAVALRQPVLAYMTSLVNGSEPSEALRIQVYDRIHDLVSLIQSVRGMEVDDGGILDDLVKALEAANGLANLFEGVAVIADHSPDFLASPRSVAQSERKRVSGRIMVVDDDAFNREILSRHLERQGHVVCQAANGNDAFAILSEAPFDIVLLDVMMPGMNGFQFLEAVRQDERLRDMSTLVVSALEDPASIARCIELGAEDYLPRDFDPVILKARIDSLLEKKAYKRENDKALRRLVETQERLAGELRDAAAYVRSLLPKRLKWRGVVADWEFIPSLSLGGDCFHYHQLDENRLALYLIDVSGHGIQAALLSATIMNMLRGLALGGVDYSSPASVLSRLNHSFRIEEQNNMFFTVWYGVYDASCHILRYASAGSPPAILIGTDGLVIELAGDGPVIGVDETAVFGEFDEGIGPGSNLYLFSDGLFEVRDKAGAILPWESFRSLLEAHHHECTELPSCLSPIKRIVDSVRRLSLKPIFDDDVSIVEFAFNE